MNLEILCNFSSKLSQIGEVDHNFDFNLCNLFTEKCENNAIEKTDTFGGWLCDFLF